MTHLDYAEILSWVQYFHEEVMKDFQYFTRIFAEECHFHTEGIEKNHNNRI